MSDRGGREWSFVGKGPMRLGQDAKGMAVQVRRAEKVLKKYPKFYSKNLVY